MSIVQKDTSADIYPNRHALNKVATQPLLDALKRCLADTITIYQQAHGFHWNVKGTDFAQYHALFESIYTDHYEAVDPTAEMLLRLGTDAPFTIADINSLRTIPDVQPVDDPTAMATALLSSNEMMLASLNSAIALATAANEQGVVNFLGGRVEDTQKWSWQLRASIGAQQ